MSSAYIECAQRVSCLISLPAFRSCDCALWLQSACKTGEGGRGEERKGGRRRRWLRRKRSKEELRVQTASGHSKYLPPPVNHEPTDQEITKTMLILLSNAPSSSSPREKPSRVSVLGRAALKPVQWLDLICVTVADKGQTQYTCLMCLGW